MAITHTNRIPLNELAMMCRRIGVSLDAGIDIRKIWQNESERGTHATATHAAAVGDRINQGDSLFEALESRGSFYPPLLRRLVKVGERSGQLDKIFRQLADHYENNYRLRRFFLGKLTWPLIELAAALFVIGLAIWILGFTGVDVFGFGLMGTSGLVTYVALLTATALLGYAVFQIIRRALGLGPVLHVLTVLPFIGDFFRTLGLSRFSWVLGLSTNTETPVGTSIDMALDATLNPYFTSHGAHINATIAQGKPINEAIRPIDAFPSEFVDAVQVGEDTGKLSETMLRMAKAYEEQVQSQSTIITTVAAFAVWGIVAIFIILMIFRLAVFYVGTINNAVDMTY